jgi:hypothetical protein
VNMSSRFRTEDSHGEDRTHHRIDRIDGTARGVLFVCAGDVHRGGRTARASNGSDLGAGELASRVGAIGHASLRSVVNRKPADILQVLAKAAGLTVEVSSSDLRPVTLTLTNVRLRTALDAICDTAACAWKLDGTTIKVTSSGASPASGLPPVVSVALDQVPVPDVFHAIGAAVGVALVIEGQIERPPVTVKFTNAQTSAVLDHLYEIAGCTWECDNGSRQLRVRFQAR